jgi:hypothetical protein
MNDSGATNHNDLPSDDRILISTWNLSPVAIKSLTSVLMQEGIRSETSNVVALSAEPPPSLLDLLTWGNFLQLTFGVFATAYIAELGKCAAKEHYEKRKSIISSASNHANRAATSLRAIVRVLMSMQDGSKSPVFVSMASNQVKFRVSMEDEDAAIDSVATSVYMMPTFKRAAETITDRLMFGGTFGYVNAIIEDGGFRLEWYNADVFQRYARKFDAGGKPLCDKYTVGASDDIPPPTAT